MAFEDDKKKVIAYLFDVAGNPLLTRKLDDAAFAVGTDPVVPIGMMADEAAPDSVDEGDVGIPRMTLSRIPWAALRLKESASADTEALTGTGAAAGAMRTAPFSKTTTLVDATANAQNLIGTFADTALYQPGFVYGFNAATWDRWRNNHPVTILASAARTAETNSDDQTNYNAKALIVIVNVSAIVDTPVLTPTLEIKDSISSNYFVAWRAAATITGTGTYAYLFDIGGAGSAGLFTEAVNLRLTRTWRFQMEVGDTDSATYSVSGENLL